MIPQSIDASARVHVIIEGDVDANTPLADAIIAHVREHTGYDRCQWTGPTEEDCWETPACLLDLRRAKGVVDTYAACAAHPASTWFAAWPGHWVDFGPPRSVVMPEAGYIWTEIERRDSAHEYVRIWAYEIEPGFDDRGESAIYRAELRVVVSVHETGIDPGPQADRG